MLYQTGNEQSWFHIHVDSREPLESKVLEALLGTGLVDDSFDHEFKAKGLNGDSEAEFPHYEPMTHMTFKTRSKSEYDNVWKKAVEVMRLSECQAYLEGEFIPLDRELTPKEFDYEAYNGLCPIAGADVVAEYDNAESLAFISAIERTKRSLPGKATTRRLNGVGGQKFRVGEIHLTVRDDTHPLLLELLFNLGFSAPAIPKQLPSGEVIRDIPLTLQVMDMDVAVRIANLAVTLINEIGGVNNASIKVEYATSYALFNEIDHETGIPPVVASFNVREDFRHLTADKIGQFECNLPELTRIAKQESGFDIKRLSSADPQLDGPLSAESAGQEREPGTRR